MSTASPKYSFPYFQPSQFALSFTHPGLDGEANKPKIRASIEQFINQNKNVLQGFKGYEAAEFIVTEPYGFDSVPDSNECFRSKLDRTRSPNVTPRSQSSLALVEIKNAEDDAINLFRLITGLETKLRKSQLAEGLTLEAVLPNWIASAGPEGSGTGGPGGWPVAYRGAPQHAPYKISTLRSFIEPSQQNPGWLKRVLSWIMKLRSNLFGGTNTYTLQDIVKNSNKGEGVDVFILDTIPSQTELDRAYKDCKDWHPLIHSLLRPGKLELHPITERRILDRLTDLWARGHTYKMKDHGLFAAGIVHTIAPCAKIHLVQVLNDYGVGDLETISWGLSEVIKFMNEKKNETRAVVVNCSLTIDLPLHVDHFLTGLLPNNNRADGKGECFADLFTEWDRQLAKEIYDMLQKDANWLARQRMDLETLCNNIYAKNSRVIAAAGNNRRLGQTVAPPARCPAALESVQGVGALPRTPEWVQNKKRKTSSYSNLADTPGHIGVATLGGEEGEGNGVVGLYLGEFPGGEKNVTKWAWWSGTSFATPVFSGVTAIELSNLPQTQTVAGISIPIPGRRVTQEAIDALYTSRQFVLESGGEGGVDILDMTQV